MFYTLRNRSVPKSNIFQSNRDSIGSDNKVNKMAGDTVVKHEVFTNPIDLPKFCGDNKILDIDNFLSLIDNHIANKGVEDDALKIETLKQFVNKSTGIARDVIKLDDLTELKDYNKYKATFRKHFKTRDDRDLIRACISLLKVKQEPQESRVGFLTRMDAKTKSLTTLLKDSDWKRDDISIEFTQLAKLLAISKFVETLDRVTAERLHKDIKPKTTLGEILCLITNYQDMPQMLDPILSVAKGQANAQQSSTQEGRQTQHQSRHTSRENRYYRNRSASRHNSRVVCYNCNKSGHVSRECWSRVKCSNCSYMGHVAQNCRSQPWCEIHRRVGHTTANCRSANSQRSNFRGRSPSPATK